MKAATNGHNEVCELLIESGCDVNLQDVHGMTALYMAACSRHTDCCQVGCVPPIEPNTHLIIKSWGGGRPI